MRSRGFQPIDGLEVTTHFQIRGENEEDGGGEFGALENERLVEAAEEDEEGGFVACSIVDTLGIAEGILEISAELFAFFEVFGADDLLDERSGVLNRHAWQT